MRTSSLLIGMFASAICSWCLTTPASAELYRNEAYDQGRQTVEQLFGTAFGEYAIQDDVALGWEARRLRLSYEQPSGSVCRVDMLLIQQKLARLDAACPTSDTSALVRQWLSQAHDDAADSSLPQQQDPTDKEVTVTLPAMATFEKTLAEALGPRASVEIPETLRASYNILMSPFSELTVAAVCGIASTPTEGQSAMNQLREAGRIDLIRNVLHGPNPGARIFAAQALIDLAGNQQRLDPADRATIETLRHLGIPIRVCRGCIISSITDLDSIISQE